MAGGPGDNGGLHGGDIITGINGATVTGCDDLLRKLNADLAGRRIAVKVLQGSKQLEIGVVQAERGEV
jgi:S1-C subfamily serine protease